MRNKRCNTNQTDLDDKYTDYKFVTETDEQMLCQTALKNQIKSLQEELNACRIRQQKLKTTNKQLLNMLVSANQLSHKKTEEFVAKVENMILSKANLLSQINSTQRIRPKERKNVNACMSKRSKKEQAEIKSTRTFSNFDTIGSFGCENTAIRLDEQNNPHVGNWLTKKDIRKRMESVHKLEMKLAHK